MAIKPIPVTLRTYYNSMRKAMTEQRENAKIKIELLQDEVHKHRTNVLKKKEYYKIKFKVNLDNYQEFVQGKYIDGKFYRVAKGLFVNQKEQYELVGELYEIFEYAKAQKELYDTEKKIEFYDKLIALKYAQYNDIIKTFFYQVHRNMIIDGVGYAFGHRIGWICINRVTVNRCKPKLDWAATKKREQELIAAGKRIYKKEEAEWCLRNGIEYKAEDKRVFLKNECFYEIAYLDPQLPGGRKLKLEPSDYRGKTLRGKTNDDVAEECNNNIEDICRLPLDLKTKISICTKIDKILYTKFIRNESQKSAYLVQTCSENR